jgi:hypothetical protein
MSAADAPSGRIIRIDQLSRFKRTTSSPVHGESSTQKLADRVTRVAFWGNPGSILRKIGYRLPVSVSSEIGR